MDIVFGKNWFEKHQQKLLWFLNMPIIKIWARWILRIRKDDLPLHATIVKIEPNNYTAINRILENGQPELRTDFRAHDKFSKRLYYTFKPFWYIFHIIDWVAFDRYEELTKLSFGFSTLTKYSASIGTRNPVEGSIYRAGVDETWGNIISGAGTGNDTLSGIFAMYFEPSATTNQWQTNYRYICCFDTSSLTNSATISNATISIYGRNKSDPKSNNPTLNIFASNPANTNNLANADYSQIGTTKFCDSDFTYANWNISDYNVFTLNASGIANISKTSISKFGVRETTYDLAGSSPTWGGTATYMGVTVNNSGGSPDAKIVITYTTTNIKTINGLAIASTKTVNGLAIGSIKTIMGVA